MGKSKTQKGKGKSPKHLKRADQPADPVLTAAANLGIEILTLDEAAELLRVSAEGLKVDAEGGNVPARFVGGEWRFMKHALIHWLNFPQGGGYKASDLQKADVPDRIVKSIPTGTKKRLVDLPVPDITPEEQEAFRATLAANRDEVDQITKSGKYAEGE